jgi:transposase
MSKITTIGLDLAKNVFHVVGCDAHGKRVRRKQLRRGQMLRYFANLPPSLVGMESCASASYWARELQALGHAVKLIPPQYVKPYVRGNKNDYNDALAIAEAVVQPQMRFAAIKTVAQQDIQALHRLRERRIAERTALCNQVRGLLGEYGIVLPRGVASLRRRVPELLEDAGNGLSELFRRLALS